MAVTHQSIEIEAPVGAVYRQWSRFEEFPRFMQGILSVSRVGRDRLRWRASICGREAEWFATVVEDIPFERLCWESEGSLLNSGLVVFESLADGSTRVELRTEYDPEAVLRAIGYQLAGGPDDVRSDLECFKELVEDMVEEAVA